MVVRCLLNPLMMTVLKLLWINQRQHLTEALTDFGDSLIWITEGHLAPGHEVDPLAMNIDKSLLTAST